VPQLHAACKLRTMRCASSVEDVQKKPWDLPWIAIYYWRSRGDLGIVVGLKNEKVEDLQKKRGIDLTHLGNRTRLLHPTKIHAHGITNLIKKGKSKSF
jgi:hypothetical protein